MHCSDCDRPITSVDVCIEHLRRTEEDAAIDAAFSSRYDWIDSPEKLDAFADAVHGWSDEGFARAKKLLKITGVVPQYVDEVIADEREFRHSDRLANFEMAIGGMTDSQLIDAAPIHLDGESLNFAELRIIAWELRHRLMRHLGMIDGPND